MLDVDYLGCDECVPIELVNASKCMLGDHIPMNKTYYTTKKYKMSSKVNEPTIFFSSRKLVLSSPSNINRWEQWVAKKSTLKTALWVKLKWNTVGGMVTVFAHIYISMKIDGFAVPGLCHSNLLIKFDFVQSLPHGLFFLLHLKWNYRIFVLDDHINGKYHIKIRL